MVSLTRAQFKRKIQSIYPAKFEQFVADLWRARGWNTRVTTDGSDRGVDVIATKTAPFHQKQVIQAKRYSSDNPVGSPQIQQYASLRQQEDADSVIVVTSGRFTEQAEKLARQLNVKLVDADSLYSIIESEELNNVVSEYISTDGLGTETHSEPTYTDTTSLETSLSSGTAKSQSTIRVRTVLIGIAIMSAILLFGFAGDLISMFPQDAPDVGAGAGNESVATQTATLTPSPESINTPAQPTSTATTAKSTPIPSVSAVCPTFPDDTTAQNVRPLATVALDNDWEITDSNGVSGLDGKMESVYITTYKTPSDTFVFLEIYKWKSETITQREANSSYENDSNFQVWMVRGEYSFAVQVYEKNKNGEIILLGDDAVEPAEAILSNVGGVSTEVGMDCVNRTANINV